MPLHHPLTHLAAEQQRIFDAGTRPDERKRQGHFGTPPVIAGFMAAMLPELPPGPLRVLDPGAGVGTLSAAVCERLLNDTNERRPLYFELWENDSKLEPRLRATMSACRTALTRAGYEMEFEIKLGDFVLEHAPASLFDPTSAVPFDLAILNPPYFKLRKDSTVARAMSHLVHGQPNIYAFFLAAATDRLREGGELIAITPRSYFNGPYFKRFRKWFFDRMTARQIHVFGSRADAFQEADVLQESVILRAEKGGGPQDVILTSSPDRTFDRLVRHAVPYRKVVEGATGDYVVRVVASRLEQEIVEVMDRFPQRFRDLPFKISTGPVVTFRSTKFLRTDQTAETAPLLWMHNVRPFVTRVATKTDKPAHILVSAGSKKLLLPAKRYVLLKRFTAKEERRRLVASVVGPEDSYAPFLGLENHLNYVHKPNGDLTREEAFGLAALFNSALVDRYFRAISGNTQVNAAEIRTMPVPSADAIREIGRAISASSDPATTIVERTVADVLGLPRSLISLLGETSK